MKIDKDQIRYEFFYLLSFILWQIFFPPTTETSELVVPMELDLVVFRG